MPITDFPPEILRWSLSYLRQDDLRRASLVCRNWLWPSRELYWEKATVAVRWGRGGYLKKLGPRLGNDSRIPRILGKLIISIPGRRSEEKDACLEFLPKVLEHFNCVRELFITNLDLTKFPQGMLSNIIVSEALIIRNLTVAGLSDVTSLIFNNRKLRHLEIGEIEVEESKRNEETQDQLAAEETRPNLSRLRHLVFYPVFPYLEDAFTSVLTWLAIITTSRREGSVVPKGRTYLRLDDRYPHRPVVSVSDTSYEETNTVYKLVGALSGTLHSLTLGMHPRMRYDLSNTTSVVNLAFDFEDFGPSEETLSDLIYTLRHVANPKSVIINIGDVYDHAYRPDHDAGSALVSDAEEEADGEYEHRSSWEEIDAMLANLEGLEEITLAQEVRVVCDDDLIETCAGSCEPDELRLNRLAKIAWERLPKCKERGLLWVRVLLSSWRTFDYEGWTRETPGPFEIRDYYRVRLGPTMRYYKLTT